MKVWVTGESSFISRNYADWLDRNKKHEFVNRLDNDYYDYFRGHESGYRGYKSEIDIFDPTLPVLISRSGADAIIHNAALVGTDYCTKNPVAALRTNIEGTLHVINAANEVGIPIIFTSTSVCYKPTDQLITEDSELEPQTIYGMTKLAGEHLLKTWAKENNYVTLIPAMLFGAHDLHSASNKLIMSGLGILEDLVHIALDPENPKPFMYIDNYLDALDIILDNIDKVRGQRINIAPDDVKPFGEVVDYVYEGMGLSPDYELHPTKDYLGPHTLSNEKLKSLGWKQTVSLFEGLDNVRDILRESRNAK